MKNEHNPKQKQTTKQQLKKYYTNTSLNQNQVLMFTKNIWMLPSACANLIWNLSFWVRYTLNISGNNNHFYKDFVGNFQIISSLVIKWHLFYQSEPDSALSVWLWQDALDVTIRVCLFLMKFLHNKLIPLQTNTVLLMQ